MKYNRIKSFTVALVLIFIGFTACKNNKKKDSGVDASDVIQVSADKDTVHVSLSANDKKKYNKSEINVYEGQTIILAFKHKGSAPKATMGHNFTLLKKGISVSNFARRASKNEKNDYIPKNTKNIIAHTKLLAGGQSDTITFDAPEKGKYDYICTFPGHHQTMHGKLIVH